MTTGIIITTGSVSPVGDPSYAYVFDIQLDPGWKLLQDGYITVYDLPYITASSLTSQPGNWGETLQKTGITPIGTPSFYDDPNVYNVTWKYFGSTIDNTNGTTPITLGAFAVGTIPESTPSVTLTYVGSLDGTNYSNMGTITVTAIPEPSSLVLLFGAIVGVPLLGLQQRIRQRSQR